MNIDKLNITNVSQRKSKFLLNTFSIAFEIDGFRYSLNVSEGDDGLVHPRYIEHLGETRHCIYCEKNISVCLRLSEFMDEIFHRLIEFPSIRLEWLYIHHVLVGLGRLVA